MSAPKILIQILITGSQIFGKALVAAGRQAYKNAQHRPVGGLAVDAQGVRNATSGSLTDSLTREQRMTLDEARLILNVRNTESLESIIQHYEHLFKANSPPPSAPPSPSSSSIPGSAESPSPLSKFTSSRTAMLQSYHSHYLLSKVVRARQRLESQMKAETELLAKGAEEGSAEGAAKESSESSRSSTPSSTEQSPSSKS